MQSSIPRFREAQSGSAAPQSAQASFPGTLRKTSRGLSSPEWSRWALLEPSRANAASSSTCKDIALHDAYAVYVGDSLFDFNTVSICKSKASITSSDKTK